MLLDRVYRDIATIPIPPSDPYRAALQYLNIQRFPDSDDPSRGMIVAADGYILVAVPCTLGDTDKPGLLDPAILRAAKPRKGEPIVVALGEATATIGEIALSEEATGVRGVVYPRRRGDHEGLDLAFPDFNRILPKDVPEQINTAVAYPITVNGALLAKLMKALGPDIMTIWPNPDGVKSPYIVVPSGTPYTGSIPEPPYGVIMPMFVAGYVHPFRRVVASEPVKK